MPGIPSVQAGLTLGAVLRYGGVADRDQAQLARRRSA